jgi:hypothetical protein
MKLKPRPPERLQQRVQRVREWKLSYRQKLRFWKRRKLSLRLEEPLKMQQNQMQLRTTQCSEQF